MCCFTRPVLSVTNTKIFVRPDKDARQFVVYRMELNAQEELAMVLPLPVKHGSDEKAMKFISLKEYPHFFEDAEKGFPNESHGDAVSRSAAMPMAAAAAHLEVVEVGDFEASFVPTEADFSRLDDRFRLEHGIWAKLGNYQKWGFAVFKLKPGHHNVHPMAFSFPRQNERELFFPTVHVHDGKVHDHADFDHTLYCQLRDGQPMEHKKDVEWRESPQHARKFMNIAKAKGIVEADEHCFRTSLYGMLPNKDIRIALQG